jgi:ATP-dependent Zn protease
LKVHVAKVKLAANVDLDQIAGLTPGFTGADLAKSVSSNARALFVELSMSRNGWIALNRDVLFRDYTN